MVRFHQYPEEHLIRYLDHRIQIFRWKLVVVWMNGLIKLPIFLGKINRIIRVLGKEITRIQCHNQLYKYLKMINGCKN